jgi:NADPH:quinone reductase-like Zn-dependent oxidoreductase
MSTPSPVRPGTMKAVVRDRYGPPEVLQLRDVPFPSFRDQNEVLIRVRAASVNPADRHGLNPPLILRRGHGLTHPKEPGIGLDLAGVVEAVGTGVQGIRVGDEVFGVGRAAFAEYAISDQTEVAPKPAGLSFEEAAALPIAGVTALQALRDQAKLQPGQRVLINGASGGVGTFVVQIAKALGADVSAVCSPPNVEMNRSFGASRIFDYTREDFTKSGEHWDVLVDLQVNHSLGAYRRVLKPGGLLMVVGAGPGSITRIIFRLIGRSILAKITGPKSKFFVASVRTPVLVSLKELVDAGKVKPVIDRRYPLSQVPDAYRYLIEGHARGKIVITL